MLDLSSLFANALPFWILCGGALLCLLIDAIWSHKLQLVVYLVGLASLATSFGLALSLWTQTPSQADPSFLSWDWHTLLFTLLISAVGFLTLLNALTYIQIHKMITAEICSLVLFSCAGMILFFAANHLLLTFIGLETLSLSIYVLVGSQQKSVKSSEAALKYFIMGGVASAIFLFGVALYYGAYGTMELGAVHTMLPAQKLEYLFKIPLALLLFGTFFKLALVPFHFWAPDVYEGAPAPITGFMATGVKIATFGFLLRLFLELDLIHKPHIQTLLSILAVMTLVVGNIMAIVQTDLKRMLAYSSISHAGFAVLGLIAGFQDGRYDMSQAPVILFYLMGYLFMTLGAFAVLSLLAREHREASQDTDLNGLGRKHPLLSGLFVLFMLSLMGFPGTVGFTAKYNIISLAVQNNHIALAILAMIMSVVSAFYYLKPAVILFFRQESGQTTLKTVPVTATITLSLCSFLVIYFGFAPDSFLRFAQIAGVSLK